jgi:uncharacterized SAM-binding protein YcdF (DUF218 family)
LILMEALLKLLVMPSTVMVLALLGALVLAPWRQSRSVSLALASLAGAIYLVFGSGPVAHSLMAGLEYRHHAPDPVPDLQHIVVLGAYGEQNPRVPLISQVNSHALVRVAEAARLAREHPKAVLTVTGGGETPGLMAEILLALGVSANRIAVDAASNSTYESALHLERRLERKAFALVTSAGHMPRAMMVFRGRGLDPIPIPTDHQTHGDIWRSPILPAPGQLHLSDLALHEYAALIWYRWRGYDGG